MILPFKLRLRLRKMVRIFTSHLCCFILLCPKCNFPPPFPADHTDAIARIERKLDDLATVDVPMSEASSHFASSLLDDLKVKITVLAPNTDPGVLEKGRCERILGGRMNMR